jgi:hypothetical protein
MCFGGQNTKVNMATGQVPGMNQAPGASAARDKIVAIEDKNIGLRQNVLWGIQAGAKKNRINPGLITPGMDKRKNDPTYEDQSKANNGWFATQ